MRWLSDLVTIDDEAQVALRHGEIKIYSFKNVSGENYGEALQMAISDGGIPIVTGQNNIVVFDIILMDILG